MGAIEEAKRMKHQGMSEEQIVSSLKEKRFSQREIDNVLSNLKISAAIQQEDSSRQTDNKGPNITETGSQTERFSGMEQSMMGSAAQESAEQDAQSQQQHQQQDQQGQEIYVPPAPGTKEYQLQYNQYPQDSYQDQYSQQDPYYQQPEMQQQYNYPQYPQQGAGVSSDTITEIAEQVASEKLSDMRKSLEKAIDFKTTIQSKTDYIEERLKRIEKIIDTLQSSVLRKIGDYVTDVQDIKKELIETQKSFSKLVPALRKAHHKPKSEKSRLKKK